MPIWGVAPAETSVGYSKLGTPADQGWELVPARPEQTAYVAGGSERWFVHHHEADIADTMAGLGWPVRDQVIHPSTRDWIQVIAQSPA